jgi:hypothetical protein
MKELVFLLEEASAKAMLQSLLPRFLAPEIECKFIVFEGKQDLQKQMEKKIRCYQNLEARFIVLRDQDSAPCLFVKDALLALCAQSKRPAACLVRIACRELEAFYLADLAAIATAFNLPKLPLRQKEAKFRTVENMGSPSGELSKITRGAYQKISGSLEIGKYLDINNTRASGFKNLVLGVRRWEKELLELPTT